MRDIARSDVDDPRRDADPIAGPLKSTGHDPSDTERPPDA